MRLPFLLLLTTAASLPAATVDFGRQIRPILSENCLFCHGPDEETREAGLRLDEEAAAKANNDGVIAVVPGQPDKSALITRIISTDPDDVMPPPKQHKVITPAQVELLKEWIRQGAPWGKHWSYEPVVRPPVPKDVQVAHPVDAFLQARLKTEKLAPAPEADAATLIRRLALDLTGLPPTLDELRRFQPKTPPLLTAKEYESVVSHYLSRPAFGEHWARMWLDLARYADSAGYPSDPGRQIWSYRDWVIDAFNTNKPFDQFTIEQIAGDLLPNPTDDQLIATAFHRNTMTQNEGGTNDEEFRIAAVVDRVNTTLAVWMGTTMACAQCHTHKYDPITHKEYYQFYAFFNQSADADKKDESPLHSFSPPQMMNRRKALEAQLAALEARFKQPDRLWLKGLPAWETQMGKALKWEQPQPLSIKTKSGRDSRAAGDGTVTVAGKAETDVYTVEVPVNTATLSALQLQTLPISSNSNFVITDFQVEVVPPANLPSSPARFVRVELPGDKKMLQLAEVQVFSKGQNLALKGTSKHSSQYLDADAKRANDGRTEGDYDKGSVSHTSGKEKNPWWEVDLGTPQAIDKIVVWNRTDGDTGKRLEGFQILLLDAKRQTVWHSSNNPAPKVEAAFAPGGPTTVPLARAVADFEQEGFTAQSVLRPKNKTNQGWAVAGATEKPHTLTLFPKAPFKVPEGSKLRVTIAQESEHKNHTLPRFRMRFTGDAAAEKLVSLPAPVYAALQQPLKSRTEPQQRLIEQHYVRNIAAESAADRKQLATLTKELAALKPVTVPVMMELKPAEQRKTHIQLRGNWEALGEEVTAAVPAVFNPLPEKAPRNRLAVAQWLVSRDNPLTARVTVNRLWESLFGSGIVQSSEEFGSQGDLPFHPELLDWLAAEFMDSGWDVKRALKLLVTSHAYRQSSASSAELNERDPDNRLLARGPRFRATGELLRDQALAVSGLLNPAMYGRPVRPLRPNLGLNTAFGGNNDWVTSPGADRHRRSVYTEMRRNSPYPSFTTFDAPNREVCTIRRSRTNTPLQAFVTLNDPVFIEANQALARRVVKEVAADTRARLQHAFQLCLARNPSGKELAVLGDLYDQSLLAYKEDPEAATKMATDPLGPLADGTNVSELAAWTTVANVIMNMDEFVMRK